MTDRSTLAGAAALAIAKIGPLFVAVLSAVLQRLYAAHVEKVQMRFAPQPCRGDRGAAYGAQHRHYFG
jgi:hypothetical protein